LEADPLSVVTADVSVQLLVTFLIPVLVLTKEASHQIDVVVVPSNVASLYAALSV
jgi:hypothetical protein